MIELDIIKPSVVLRRYLNNIWPEDEYLYVYEGIEIEHCYIKCDNCTFWDGNYTITLDYDNRAYIRLNLFKGDFEQVRNITKNKRRLYE